MFADTDFFLALLKESDWLKRNALKVYAKHKREIWTSESVVIELFLVSEEFGLDPEELVVSLSGICKLRANVPKLLLAAHYMKKFRATTFDSLHAAYSDGDTIISSDKIFEHIGLQRIKLEED